MFLSLKKIPRELLVFIFGVALIGFGESMVNSTFNNFLDARFTIKSFQRTFLEIPRELPGMLVIFISAALFFLPNRRFAGVSAVIGCVGLGLISLFSSRFHVLYVWLFIYSAGQHLLMPLVSSIGMQLAREGQDGRRLGQVNAIRNAATILGSFFVFIGFKYLHFNFTITFIVAGAAFLGASFFFFSMHPGKKNPPSIHLKFHKEYRLYYWLSILFGTRKQIFLTFAPWVLVTVYHQPTTVLATLLTIGGIAGIVFQPLLGHAVDRLGEKKVLLLESVALVFVCAGYGCAQLLFSEGTAFFVAAACFVADQLLMSVNMARSTYLKKIALDPSHITPTLTMSVSLDHVFSIGVALLGGLLWSAAGYQYVFLFGGLIATVNFVSALRMRVFVKSKIARTG
ncbi:MAG: MFS transporter [Chitinispirillaceae bacterium]|nr:MFS transporter [Chitinispirillaceae bacterium]